jgi:hypothetical protein
MKKLIPLIVLLAVTPAFGQKTFDVKNASKFFDIKIDTTDCDDDSCKGPTKFSFYKKGGTKAYQVISVDETYLPITSGGQPLVNTTLLYDEQSVLDVDDYNFDGMEDVAICNGQNGSYGMPSYDIYLSSRKAGKFVYSDAFTDIASHLGMFKVLKKTRQIETFDKSGCCLHYTERYKIVGNKPVKVFSEEEDATSPNTDKVKITTKTLVGGKWKKSVKYVKQEGP